MAPPAEKPRRFASRGFRLAMAAALISLVGSTFAINIVINGNNRVEFGQGIYRITSCDQFINVNLKSGTAFADGLSRVGSIEISGLDVARCAGSSLRLRLYNETSTAPMNIFTNVAYTRFGVSYPCCSETGTAVIMVIASGAQQSTAGQSVTLINPAGRNIGYGDRQSQSIRYEASTGVFSIAFQSPLAIMRDVAKTTFESASNA